MQEWWVFFCVSGLTFLSWTKACEKGDWRRWLGIDVVLAVTKRICKLEASHRCIVPGTTLAITHEEHKLMPHASACHEWLTLSRNRFVTP